MARQVIVGSRPVALAARVPGGSARRHSPRCHLRRSPSLSSTFLRSLRSRPVTALPRYYGRSDSCPPDSWTLAVPNACSTCGQVSLIHALGLPTIPYPTTGASPGRLRTPSRSRPDVPPLARGRASLIICRLTVPRQPNRVRLPTDWSFTSCCSPPRLATTQLQAGYSLTLDRTGEDFHLSNRVRSQAHRCFAQNDSREAFSRSLFNRSYRNWHP